MEKSKNLCHTLCIEKIVSKKPILTEQEMNDFCSFEEIIADARAMFDEKIKTILSKNDSKSPSFK
mgnify:CR=1 FL=1